MAGAREMCRGIPYRERNGRQYDTLEMPASSTAGRSQSAEQFESRLPRDGPESVLELASSFINTRSQTTVVSDR